MFVDGRTSLENLVRIVLCTYVGENRHLLFEVVSFVAILFIRLSFVSFIAEPPPSCMRRGDCIVCESRSVSRLLSLFHTSAPGPGLNIDARLLDL